MSSTMFRLADKVAIVTGATGLLGREHCHALASAGARVVVADLDQAACASFAGELQAAHGTESIGQSVDITDPDSVAALLKATLGAFDRVDVLVNNAAIDDKAAAERTDAEATAFENYPLSAWKRMIDVNVTGTFLCCQVIGAHMAERGTGSIINVASTYGLVAPDQSMYRRPDGSQAFFKSAAYPTSKGAVLQLTRFLGAYWGGKVRVNALCPGGVMTENTDPAFAERYAARTPAGRMADRGDYRGAVVFLASDDAAYMTGNQLVVDGGWTCL
ncbi:SDR family oxidoreductase [Haliangium ochraceum]|uniref:Short-chain dehydrogenase/reductase SDR n=1 Tax=Haliangium ochraceum (strain DSM 14365 / JCM 11303 / SMP-2) TaxID=502025 RepID=D0LIV6_HALO1|nr:SDR family oxidoreductase [Haliangium ochraceum]ACY12985.1 short-chain dehydrogenase/reductase SDR [Haliangium ochraceum DSM 14365]